MKTFACVLVLALALPAAAAERSVVGKVTFESAPKPREPKAHLRYPAPIYPAEEGDGIGFREKESMWDRHLDRLPYGDGAVYHGSEYGRKDRHDHRSRNGFIGEGALYYGAGYSSNRVNWDFLLRR